MGSGYVLDFSNRTFGEFVFENTGVDVYADAYETGGTSKANRLRTFWSRESDYRVGQLLAALLDRYETLNLLDQSATIDQPLLTKCRTIVDRLRGNASEQLDSIDTIAEQMDFRIVAEAMRSDIERGHPQAAMDRLHTFTVRYVRSLTKKHDVEPDRSKSLTSTFGEYVKVLRQGGQIASPVTERILKTSISVLEALNTVRNEQSLAHDNPLLNYDEANYVFRSIANLVEFLDAIDPLGTATEQPKESHLPWDDDVPF